MVEDEGYQHFYSRPEETVFVFSRLKFGGLGVCEFEEDGVTDQATPRDFLSNLKSIEVSEFSGSKNELCFLKFLLKNARALETMTIISSSELLSDPDKQLEVTKQLLMVPKGSMHSVIDIS
ncbi:hypothetical protein IFM89_005883 [Coptis chinensis]|uniref:FBD domain-containing protein n=1 Tax=Coptis chinensis TaxID=261450 RepID=A0A835HL61_9MAGN|nr:hypothetical protein IFM89_005883 [Coptis chinensis]